MYDDIGADYDRFVNWPSRLEAELPLIERELEAIGARRIMDAACGTGMHAIALAQRGYQVAAADLSAGMVEQGQANAAAAGVDIDFRVAGFGELAEQASQQFDAVLCLGNSLPHVLTPEGLRCTLEDFAACLRPDGLLLVQNRNFDAVLSERDRWMAPQAYREPGTEWLFLRFYDFEPDGRLAFNLVTLRREDGGQWHQRAGSTRLWPLRQEELKMALNAVGFVEISLWGDMAGAPLDPDLSPNLVAGARKQSGSTGGQRA